MNDVRINGLPAGRLSDADLDGLVAYLNAHTDAVLSAEDLIAARAFMPMDGEKKAAPKKKAKPKK